MRNEIVVPSDLLARITWIERVVTADWPNSEWRAYVLAQCELYRQIVSMHDGGYAIERWFLGIPFISEKGCSCGDMPPCRTLSAVEAALRTTPPPRWRNRSPLTLKIEEILRNRTYDLHPADDDLFEELLDEIDDAVASQ